MTGPTPPVQLNGNNYKLEGRYNNTNDNNDFIQPDDQFWRWTRVYARTITAAQHLPTAQLLGQATLVEFSPGCTAMISIAELATVVMDDSYCQLLWIMVRTIEKGLRAGGRGRCTFEWTRDMMGEYVDDDRGVDETQDAAKARQEDAQIELQLAERRNAAAGFKFRALGKNRVGPTQSTDSSTTSSNNSNSWKTLDPGTKSKQAAKGKTEDRYKKCFADIGLRQQDDQWFLVSRSGLEDRVFAMLSIWLEAVLGGTEFPVSGPLPFGLSSFDLDSIPVSTLRGCWRKKIVSGRVLVLPDADPEPPKEQDFTTGQPVLSSRIKNQDFLLLTAAALWSLFDNSLQRVPNCFCTFQSAGGDFLQCQGWDDGWLLWHTFSGTCPCQQTDEGCNANNIRIALSETEQGVRLDSRTPCALGWLAKGRDSPNSPIWKTMPVTTRFRREKLVKYKVKEIQALAQLSVPLAVAPQLGGAISFAKQHFTVANSIDSESIIAMERAAAAVVLLFDEKRNIHLTLDGADVIEMCCMQFLREMGCDTEDIKLPPFSHATALMRMQTWYNSVFVSSRKTRFTGDHLVRQATKKVSELLDTAKRVYTEDATLVYWLMEDVLRGGFCQATKPPRFEHTSWHQLASAAPPLILVVGEIHDDFVTLTGARPRHLTLRIQVNNRNRSLLSRGSRFEFRRYFIPEFYTASVPGGILASRETITRWTAQAQLYFQAEVATTANKISFGDAPTEMENTFEVVKQSSSKGVDKEFTFGGCECLCGEKTKKCLHYIQ